MAFVILGLLHLAPQSLYDLIKNFEAGVALFYSASAGSIKRALDQLAASGSIEVESVQTGGRGRKVYRVTDAGRQEFRAWMAGDLMGADFEAAALPRVFFLGLLPPEERAPVLDRIRRRIDADLAGLEAVAARIDGLDVAGEHRDVLTYQRVTLDYGLAAHRHAAAWFAALDAEDPVHS